MRKVLLAFCLSFVGATAAYSQASFQCDTIITKGLREYDISSQSFSYLNAVYSQYCHASGQKKESSSGFGLESVAKALPVKLTGGASDASAAVSNFCKTYQGTTAAVGESATYQEKIVGRAYDSYVQCAQLAALGYHVAHDLITIEKAQVLLRAGVGKPIELNGVDTSANVKCEGAVDGKPVRYVVGTNAKSNVAIGMFCTREARVGSDGTKVFDEGSVAIDITGYKYNFYWPKSEILPEDVASTVQVSIGQLRTQLSNLVSGLATKWGATRDGNVTNNRGSGGPFESTCPAGHYAVGMKAFGNTAGPACIGCFVNMQVLCRKLNAD